MEDLSHIPAPADPIPLEPFELIAPLARGGMAQVWRGRHADSGVAVAGKILSTDNCDDTYRRRLRHEVRSIARLEHPNIVDVYDYGEVSEASAMDSGGRFRPGQPYVVMEFAPGGTLRDSDVEFDWPSYRDLLLTLLEALGHAHARGIIHRDLKPSNVLEVGLHASRRLALSDFGLAYLTGRDNPEFTRDNETQGTPAYMAPEQFREKSVAYGPWTDLYGFGCLAWEIATGRPPFYGPNAMGVAWKHIEESLPAFEPVFQVPDDFRGWLDGLLGKDPGERFHRAADAARALRRLDDGADGESTSFGRPGVHSRLPLADDDCAAEPPSTCRLDETRHPRPYLAGTSLGLYTMRRPALIDRDDERDLLWQRLRRVARQETPEMVLLHGPSGTGKTRLAEWFRERTEELGCGRGFEVLHSASNNRRDGLAAMVARHLRLDQADSTPPGEVIREWFQRHGLHDDYAGRSLTSLLADAGLCSPEQRPDMQIERFEQYAGALERFFRCAASAGPVVLHLDDIAWGDDSIRFAEHILETVDDLSLLLVATLRDDTLADVDADRREALRQLDRHSATTEVRVGPLGPEDHRRLIAELLDLRAPLKRSIAERTDGNPLFAIQTLNHCVERDLLVRREDGFELADEADLPSPTDLTEVWRRRIEALLEDFGDDAAEALELAAALGREVDAALWRTCCELADLEPSDDLLEVLFDRRLAHSTDMGWAFAHPMLREGLERRARERETWSDHHATCLAALTDDGGPDSLEASRQAAEHALEADEPGSALEHLLSAVARTVNMGAVDAFMSLFDRLEVVVDEIELDHSRPEYAEFLIRKGRYVLVSQEGVPRAESYFARALELVESQPDFRLQAEAHRGLGKIHHKKTNYGDAIACFERSMRVARKTDTPDALLGTISRDLGESLIRAGQTSRAREVFEQSLDHLEAVPSARAKVRREIAISYDYDERLGRAREEARRALELVRDQLSLYGEARALNLLGDLDRKAGDLETAAEAYDRAADIADILGAVDLGFIFLSRAQVALERDSYREAHRRLRRARHEPQIREAPYFRFLYWLFRSWAAAGVEDWEDAHEALDTLEDFDGDMAADDPDVLDALEQAFRLARNADRLDLARRLREHLEHRPPSAGESDEADGRVDTA